MRSRCGINTLKYRIGWIEKFFDVLTIWLIVFWILVMCQLPITEVTDIHVQIIDESQMDSAVAKPGATVTILDLSEEGAEPESFTIVGTFETDPLNGKISNESPLAKAILEHGVNEIVSVGVAEPYEVKILKIEYIS